MTQAPTSPASYEPLADQSTPLLDVHNLSVEFAPPRGEVVRVVRDVSFSVEAGQIVALVGESGSGKTVTSLSVLRLLGQHGRIADGEIRLEGRDLVPLPERSMRELRGDRISMVLQDAMTSLNPVHPIGRQIAEVLRRHRNLRRGDASARAVELLRSVGLVDAAQRAREYPHQLSGGMRQRVMIAMALACDPSLLVADEPTTALDVTVEAQILALIAGLCREAGTAVLLVTHNLGVVADIADRVLVMYGGSIVESGPVDEVLSDPRHPYTRGLLLSQPDRGARGEPLRVIPGQVPSPAAIGAGCPFASRCAFVTDTCRVEKPELVTLAPGTRQLACPVPLPGWQTSPVAATPGPGVDWAAARVGAAPERAEAEVSPLLQVRDLVKTFPGRSSLGLRRERRDVHAVARVSFDLLPGETLGLVGESGCGKSTTARMVARLLEPTSGSVVFGGADITHIGGEQLRQLRRDVQVVFQDPLGSLDPRYSARDSVREPLTAFDRIGRKAQETRVAELLDLVGISSEQSTRAPHQLSGGQRQRVAIARALALQPRLVVCDEPVASLDVSIQAQVVNLLAELQRELGLAYLFISHDLGVVQHVSDRIAVMYLGQIVEIGSAQQVTEHPLHPYTQALLASMPGSTQRREAKAGFLTGEPPEPSACTTGCAFAPRCPFAEARCLEVEPELRALSDGSIAACHRAEELSRLGFGPHE